jgi:nicotinamidase-related amidase
MKLERDRTALLVMDLQNDIVAMFDKAPAVVDRAAMLVAAARKAHVPVIFVVVGFRPGYPEMSANNQSFQMITQTGRFVADTPGVEVAPALRPEAGEVVVTKHRVSAFAGTDLEMVLRAKKIDTLVLAGVATSGVVLSTTRHASDADYRIVIAADACADRDDEVHRVLVEKVFPRQATVTTAADVVAALS